MRREEPKAQPEAFEARAKTLNQRKRGLGRALRTPCGVPLQEGWERGREGGGVAQAPQGLASPPPRVGGQQGSVPIRTEQSLRTEAISHQFLVLILILVT